MALTFTVATFAQSADVTSAILSFNKQEYKEAKTFIDQAYNTWTEKNGVGVKEKVASKLFHYRGVIYLTLHASDNAELNALGGEKALETAVQSFTTLFDVDVKNRYTSEAKINLLRCSDAYQNAGYKLVSAEFLGRPGEVEDYKKALPFYEKAFEVKQLEVLSERPLDTLLLSNIAIIAQNAQEYEVAADYYRKMIELNYQPAIAYNNLVGIYLDQENYDAAKEVLAESKEKIGANLNLIIKEVNMYIGLKETDKALDPLLNAIQAQPENALFHNAIGGIYLELEQLDSAQAAFKRAAELAPEMENPWYQLGYIEVQKANEWLTKAQDLKYGDKRYDSYKKKAMGFYAESLQYFEKALEADEDSIDTLKALKEVYYQLDENEKLKATIAKLKEKGAM